MKLPLKIGSVIMAMLMLVTSLTAGFAAVAADQKYVDLVTAIEDGKKTIDPSHEYYVKDLANYTVTNTGDKWSDEGQTLAYKHAVTAKDNIKGSIALASRYFYSIVDNIQSIVLGDGCYNTSLIASEVKTNLYSLMSGEDHIVRTDESGKKLYVAPTGLSVNKGMETAIELDEYSSDIVRESVFPANASNTDVYWRVISGSSYVAVGQDGRVYAKRPTPDGFMAQLECVAVDSLDVVSPAVYNENGELVKAPVISFDNAVRETFYVVVKDVAFTSEQLLDMLSKYEPDAADKNYSYEQMDNLYRGYILETYPDYGKTNNYYLAQLAEMVPENLSEADAKTMISILLKENISDAEFETLASFCYGEVQDAVLEAHSVDIASIDLSKLSDSGLDNTVVSGIKKIIREKAEAEFKKCGYTSEYKFFNVDTLVNYFLGNSNVINAANWFHSFEYTVSTDLETAMEDIFKEKGDITVAGANNTIAMNTYSYSWSHRVEYDKSGTKASYVLDGTYAHSSSSYTERTAFSELSAVNIAFDNLYNSLPGNIAELSSADCKSYAETFNLDKTMNALLARGFSSELLHMAFGKKFYWINSIYNQCRPNYTNNQAKSNRMSFADRYGYRANVRTNPDGSSVPYELTSDKMAGIVDTIDAMLTDTNVAKVVSTFLKFDDPKYLGKPVYGAKYDTLQEMLQILVQSLLYTGNIPTTLLKKVYPILCDLIMNTLPEKLYATDIPVLGNVGSVIDSVNASEDETIGVTLLRALNSAGICIFPYEFVENWTEDMKQRYPSVYNILHQEKFRPAHVGAIRPGWDLLTEDEWEAIERGWNVSTRNQFEDALAVSLNSFLPLLATLLGSSELSLRAVGFNLKVNPVYLYEYVILPLMKALGVEESTIKNSTEYYNAGNGDDKLVLLKNITTPLLDWLENEVMEHPVQSIADLLVNVTSLLSYSGEDPNAGYNGFVQTAISRCPGLSLQLQVALWYTINIFDGPGLYNLIAGLLPEGLDLGSLNGILGVINFGAPIVESYDEFGEPVFRRTITDEDGNITEVTTTKDKALADTTKVELPPIQEGKLKECGRVIPTYDLTLITNPNNSKFSRCFYEDVNAGQVLLFLLRYILYGIMNTTYSHDSHEDSWNDPCLLDSFLSPWDRSGEVIAGTGLSIGGIINNVIYNPEASLCALMELFAPNEHGEFDIEGNMYKLEYPDYQQDILLEKDENGKLIHDTFGAKVNYTKYWSRENAQDTVTNLEEIVGNVLSMLGMGSLDKILGDLISDNLYTNDILSKLASALFTALQSLQTKVDLRTILESAFDIKIDVNTLYNTLVYTMYMKYGFTEPAEMPMILRKLLTTINNAGIDGAEWSKDLFFDKLPVFDENGNPVMETVIVTDEEGNKVQETDSSGNPVVDEDGNPVYKTEIKQKTEEVPFDWGFGETAVLDFILDEEGNKIPAVDENGDAIVDENGDPIYKQKKMKSESGKIVEKATADGSVIISREDVFFNAVTAILSPVTLLFQRILLGKNLSVFTNETAYPDGLLTIPMYQIYYYAIIPLFEALCMPNIVSYDTIVAHVNDRTVITTEGTKFAPQGSKLGASYGDVMFFEDLLSPVRGLIHKVLADPISTILDLVPNLLFYISIGALNDTLNCVLHFAYVLLDILSPIVDVVPIVNKLIGSLEVFGMTLNLSLPLEVDFNTIINQLISSFTEGTITSGPLQGSQGIEVTDGLFIKLPPIDLSMLCVGRITPYNSASKNEIVRIGTGDGADFVTVLLQFVMDTLFMYENSENIANWAAYSGKMDDFDAETVSTALTTLNKTANEEEMPDKAMYLLYALLKYVAPITGELADRLALMPNGTDADGNPVYGMTIQQFFAALQSSDKPLDVIKTMLTAKPSDNPQIAPAMSFLQRLIQFFQRIFAAIRALFKR